MKHLRDIVGSFVTAGSGRVLPGRNSRQRRRRRGGVVLALAAAACAGGVGPAKGQEAQPDAEAIEAPLVDPSHAEAGFRLVERWVRHASVPGRMPRQLRVTGAIGVRVSLRDSGREVGSAEAWVAAPEASLDRPGPAVDLVPLLARAADAALTDYAQTLREARARVAPDAQQRASPAAPTPEDTAGLGVGLEVAHELRSVHVARRASMAELYAKFAPGFHGLRVKGPAGQGAAVTWPSVALAHNTSPKSQLVQPLSSLGYPLDAIRRVGRTGGAPLERFQTLHVIRVSPHRPVQRLIRGNDADPPRQPVGELIAVTGDRIAGHLGMRFIREDQVRGTYHPSTNRFDPALAGPTDSALAAFALARYSGVMDRLDRRDVRAQVAGERALAVAATVGRSVLDDGDAGPAAAALALMTLTQLPVGGADQALRDRLGAHLLSLRGEDGAFYRDAMALAEAELRAAGPEADARGADDGNDQDKPRPVNLATASLIAASLTALHAQTRDADLEAAARAAIDAAYARLAQRPDVAALPWLMMAHDRAAGALAEDHETNAEQWRTLGRYVDVLNEQHIFERPLLGPGDVVGGFELSRAALGSPPNPDWRTGQLLLFLSIALRHEEVRGQRNPFDWLVPAQGAARFLARLTFDPTNAFYARSPQDTLGGVRISLWDNTLAIAPSAIGLLAMTELQATTDVLNRARANPIPGPEAEAEPAPEPDAEPDPAATP